MYINISSSLNLSLLSRNFLPNKHLAPVEADLLHINRLFWSLSQKQLREVQATMAARSSSNPKVGNIQTSRNALSTVPAKVHRIPGRIQSNKVRMQLPNSRSQSGGRIPTVPTYRPIRPLPTVSAQLTSAFGYTNIRGPPVLATTPLVAVRPKTFVFSGSPVVGTLIQSSTVAPRIQSAPKSFGQEVNHSH